MAPGAMIDDRVRATTLHVTNGDATTPRLRAGGIEGAILPWRDVLHDGPVPGGHSPAELRRLRAAFLGGRGWGDATAIAHEMAERDAALMVPRHDVVLWFEHDLYDQLQLLQVLDALHDAPVVAVLLAQADDYLGTMPPERVRALEPQPVTDEQRELAHEAWRAFCGDDPRAVERIAARGDDALRPLPHLRGALLRLLEELPGARDGLARSERQALEALAPGGVTLAAAFAASATREPAIYLGDASFAWYLANLAEGERPLLRLTSGAPLAPPAHDTPASHRDFWSQKAELTPLGRAVLAGDADRIAERGIDRWLGGVHLTGRSVKWRWDGARVLAS